MLSKSRIAWCVISLGAFLAGLWAGRPAPELPAVEKVCPTVAAVPQAEPTPPAPASSREQELEEALEGSWLATLRLATKVDSLESLLEELQGGELDHRGLVRTAVANLGERQLQSIVTSAAQLSPEDVEEVEDLPAFATRLAEVAMEDIVEPSAPAIGAQRVVFTTAPETREPEIVARSSFAPDQRRIYAVFPTAEYERDAVMMKWYRSAPPQILLFERYPIRPGEAYGYVWLQPKEGWELGQYQVDILAADEAVTRLARGHYTVVR
jgi:hypothetical protein